MESLVIISFVATSAVTSSLASSLDGFFTGLENDVAALKQSWASDIIDINRVQDTVGSNSTIVLSRNRRFLSFPSGTVAKINLKIAMKHWSYGSATVKGDYRLENVWTFPTASRRRRSLAEEREALFGIMQSAFDMSGLDGRSCVLRAVCEVAEAPMDEFGIYGELFNLIFSPGYKGAEELSVHKEAEEYGRAHGGCWAAFPQCPISMRGILQNTFLDNMEDDPSLIDTVVGTNYI